MGQVLNIIDLASFLDGHDPQQAAEEFRDAMKTWGFCYISGFEKDVPSDLVEKVFDFNTAFFALPQATKDSLEYTSSEANRGYLSPGREQPSLSTDPDVIAEARAVAGDQKETFEIGNDCTPEYPEHWPAESALPGFRETMNSFHQKCHLLHLKLMSLLAISLKLPSDHFLPFIQTRSHNLRLLHYPPAARTGSNNRLGAHQDFGTLTILFQDTCGGLEVTSPSGEWVPVEPIPNTFILNVGDILSRWSNDLLKSTIHRAVLPPLREGEDPRGLTRTRLSVAYFCNPDPEAVIECIPGLGEPKYGKVVAKDYYAAALAAEIGV